jgi:hypothetical protein
MDTTRKLGIYDNHQLFDINVVHMHLKVMILLDVVPAQGKQITEEVFKGTKPMDQYYKLKWPRQMVTTTKQQKLWKAALEAAFMLSGRTLQQPLGNQTHLQSCTMQLLPGAILLYLLINLCAEKRAIQINGERYPNP